MKVINCYSSNDSILIVKDNTVEHYTYEKIKKITPNLSRSEIYANPCELYTDGIKSEHIKLLKEYDSLDTFLKLLIINNSKKEIQNLERAYIYLEKENEWFYWENNQKITTQDDIKKQIKDLYLFIESQYRQELIDENEMIKVRRLKKLKDLNKKLKKTLSTNNEKKESNKI